MRGLSHKLQPSLNELATGFIFSISAIFANRLMISLRETYYKQQETSRATVPGSNLRFRTGLPTQASTSFLTNDEEISTSGQEVTGLQVMEEEEVAINLGGSGDDIELQTFNERAGF